MTKTVKLFGTDGIRQEVGHFPLDDNSLLKLGRALGTLTRGARILIGRDTRESGPHIERLITAGITGIAQGSGMPPGSSRWEIAGAGVIPTPGLSFITQQEEFDYGIMITASHNHYKDNGIKIFGSDGEKIPEEKETQLEEIFYQLPSLSQPLPSPGTGIDTRPGIRDLYGNFLISHAPILEPGKSRMPLKILLDCANGATFAIAPQVFREAGTVPIVLNAAPDGKNINNGCGSTHLEPLKEAVQSFQADLGIAFDGDGDRVLFVDNAGHTLDGDHILYILSRYFLSDKNSHRDTGTPGNAKQVAPAAQEGGLGNSYDAFNKTVVGTVMGNLGLEKALGQLGITFIRTNVGDKYVYREMKRSRSILGGEQSGHIILRCFQKTGDGILTALYFLNALAYLGIQPGEVFEQFSLFPQVTKSIAVKEKRDLSQWDRLNEQIALFNEKYGDNSRLLIRYSGTESQIRLMMESEQQTIITENFGKFEDIIRSTIGD